MGVLRVLGRDGLPLAQAAWLPALVSRGESRSPMGPDLCTNPLLPSNAEMSSVYLLTYSIHSPALVSCFVAGASIKLGWGWGPAVGFLSFSGGIDLRRHRRGVHRLLVLLVSQPHGIPEAIPLSPSSWPKKWRLHSLGGLGPSRLAPSPSLWEGGSSFWWRFY